MPAGAIWSAPGIRHRIEIVAVDGVVTQHVGQHGKRVPARVVAFPGIDSERTFQREIAEAAPAGIGREIVGIEGHQRIRLVMVDASEPAMVVALEHHHLI